MKNAEAAISSRRGGVKSLRTGGGLKKFRTWAGGGGLPILGGDTFAGGGGGGAVPHYMPWNA